MGASLKTIYFAGQDSFGNRGCEALVRSTVKIIRENLGEPVTFLVPSKTLEDDRKQWPDHADWGVEFVEAPKLPFPLKLWCSVTMRIPPLNGLKPPAVPRFSRSVEQDIRRSDALLMIGGDIISLDYGIHSLYYWAGLVERARQMGVPTMLWAASVGPFAKLPKVEQAMRGHLLGYRALTVRESASVRYVEGLTGHAPPLVGDPAFHLYRDDNLSSLIDGRLFDGPPVLAFNVSPLIREFRHGVPGAGESLDAEILAFLRWLVAETDYRVLLLYHVDPFVGEGNSDYAYMQGLLQQMEPNPNITLLPKGLNAAQLKSVIAQCRFLLAARTHATIAALSQGVPCISIGYSVKAKAINQDLFGHQDFVLETPSVAKASLIAALRLLESREEEIRAHLQNAVASQREGALRSVQALSRLLVANR